MSSSVGSWLPVDWGKCANALQKPRLGRKKCSAYSLVFLSKLLLAVDWTNDNLILPLMTGDEEFAVAGGEWSSHPRALCSGR